MRKKRRVKANHTPFERFLTQLRKDIFEAAFDIDICGFGTINALADEASLSWQTVQRLYEGDTHEPRLRTLFKLAKAVRMDLGIVKEGLNAARETINKKLIRRRKAVT